MKVQPSKRILRELERHRLSVVSQRSKNHLVLTVADISGNKRIIVMGITPSDRRAERNAIAQIRQTALNLA